jgi:hypothetical protein
VLARLAEITYLVVAMEAEAAAAARVLPLVSEGLVEFLAVEAGVLEETTVQVA